MSIVQGLPSSIGSQIEGPLLFSARTDLLHNGHFGEQWIVITSEEVTVWTP
ncbi:hypothetical protein [Paenibacillus urinalis]|uniref:hypothetical protein n=1 Tax=Paenibacillus urinalis TaxID=521520 RepID=UPI00362AF2F9